jgi:hypothetical protein
MKKVVLVYPGLLGVWELVQSMSKRDKIRFREMAKLQNGKLPNNPDDVQYVKFFNAVEGAKVFDKAKIKEKLVETTLLKDFSDKCSYLYHAVLRAIHASSDDTLSELADTTSQIKILVYKGLHHHVPAMYQKAMAIAQETEDFGEMLKLMQHWRVSIIGRQVNRQQSADLIALDELEEYVWQQMINLREWEQLYSLRMTVRGLQGEEHQACLTKINEHPLYGKAGVCKSIKAEILRHLTMERPLANDDPMQPERIPKLIALANLIEANSQLFEDSLVLQRYLNVAFTLGVIAIEHKQNSIVDLAIEKLEKIASIGKETEAMIFERMELLKITRIRDWTDFGDADESINRITAGLDFYRERVSRKQHINLILAISEIYLLTERPGMAAKLLAPQVNYPPVEDSPQPSILLWVYYLIAEYELGHTDIMQRWAEGAVKYMHEHAIDDEVGLALVPWLRSLSKKNDPNKRKSELRRFSQLITPLLSHKQNRYYVIRFPLEMKSE